MTASDKLFFWLFQSQPDRILQLLPDLPADAGGYRFVAPVFKALEHRPDGMFLTAQQDSDIPALVLEAQMQADPEFFLRLYAESGRFLLQEKTIRRWQVVVLCPLRTLALLLEKEERLPATTAQIRSTVAGTALESQIADATAAILLARFTSRPIPEICAMGGITLEDFSKSVAYREIFGLGEARGRELGLEQGLKTGELELTMRLLQRRCGGLTPSQEARIRALPLPQLEALAEALLDFQAAADLEAWLATS
jgi:predicted transposase YdaD